MTHEQINCETCEGDLSRRDFLRLGAIGAGVATVGAFGFSSLTEDFVKSAIAGTARPKPTGMPFMTVINMYGGNDGLNMVVPVKLAPYEERRKGIAIPDGQLHALEGSAGTANYKLHPSLGSLAKLYKAGEVAIVHRVGYPRPNLSHFLSEDIWSLGQRNEAAGGAAHGLTGWIARYADRYAATPMGVMSVGLGRRLDFVGAESNPLLVRSLNGFNFLPDAAYPDNHASRLRALETFVKRPYYRRPLCTEMRQGLERALGVAEDMATLVAKFEPDGEWTMTEDLSQRMRDISTLIRAGAETRVFYTGYSGFDTHANQIDRHAQLLTRLDNAIASFERDMKEIGVWDKTAITVITEFGRRNYQNGSAGTDHGGANCMFVIGGAVKGGIYGPDLTEEDLNKEYLTYEVDFRNVYSDIVENHLGADPTPIFTEELEKTHKLGLIRS